MKGYDLVNDELIFELFLILLTKLNPQLHHADGQRAVGSFISGPVPDLSFSQLLPAAANLQPPRQSAGPRGWKASGPSVDSCPIML